MPESTEPSSTQPIAGEAQSESPNAVHSEDENSAVQNVVPPNLVEIYQILKPVVSPGEEKEEEEETEDTGDEESLPHEEQMTAEATPHEPEQEIAEKEPLPSAKTYEEATKAFERRDLQETNRLVHKAARQSAEERRAEE